MLIFLLVFILILIFIKYQSAKENKKNITIAKSTIEGARLCIKTIDNSAKFVATSNYPLIYSERYLHLVTYNVIDFATANMYPDSICRVEITEVVNNIIVQEHSYLVRPPYNDFTNTDINGISLSMVINAPTFLELWPKIEHLINGKLIATYNAKFDIGCLEDILKYFNIQSPQYAFFDILETTKAHWQHSVDHKLATVYNLLDNTEENIGNATKAAKVQLRVNSTQLFYNNVSFKKMEQTLTEAIVLQSVSAEQLWSEGKNLAASIKSNSIADYKLVFKYFDAAVDKGIAKSRIFREYGELMELCGQYEKAIECYEKAIELGDKLGLKRKIQRLQDNNA